MKLLQTALLFAPLAAAMWPIPSSYSTGHTVLWIGDNCQVTYNGADTSSGGTYGGNSHTSKIIHTAIQRTYDTIFNKNFIPWKFHPRGSNFEPSTSNKKYINSITLEQTSQDPDNVLKPLAGDVDESYELTLTKSGDVTIKAKTSIGLVRGLTSFTQLFYEHSKGGAYTNLAPVSITDAPKFTHRGFNMDVSRQYFSVDDIKRQIDAIAYNKFNRFHLHATDSQSWPLEIPALPELAQNGAYAPGMTYSPQDIKDIQLYGALQGVEVYIEMDMPGHTGSIWYSHPELITAWNIQPNWGDYAAEPPSGNLKLKDDAVDQFLNTLLGDLLPRVSPYTSYFHTGGDEVNFNPWTLEPGLMTNDSDVILPLLEDFVLRNHKQVRANGLTPIVWEETLLEYNVSLGKDVVIQTWKDSSSVKSVVSKGYKALVGSADYWYLDCGSGAWIDYSPESVATGWPFNDWCGPRKSWRLMYAYDPLNDIPEADQHLVIGGECHIWTEQTAPENLDRMVWPRAAAAGEVLWSGAKDAQGQNRSQITASPRLSEMRERLVARGVMAEPVQMPWCTMNGTQCYV